MKKIIKFIIIGILLYVSIIVVEFGWLYAMEGDEIWNNLKDFWNWYKKLL